MTADGITAGYSLPIPSIGVGVFSLENISLSAALTLPFFTPESHPVPLRFLRTAAPVQHHRLAAWRGRLLRYHGRPRRRGNTRGVHRSRRQRLDRRRGGQRQRPHHGRGVSQIRHGEHRARSSPVICAPAVRLTCSGSSAHRSSSTSGSPISSDRLAASRAKPQSPSKCMCCSSAPRFRQRCGANSPTRRSRSRELIGPTDWDDYCDAFAA